MSDTDRIDTAAMIVAEAVGWIGTPYRHQAGLKGVGCDCIGLVLGVWRSVYGRAPDIPGPYAPDWAEAGGGDVLLEAARRHCHECECGVVALGHLLVFRWRPHLPAKHLGIAIDPVRFIHAYQGTSVTISALAPQWRRRIAGVFTFPNLNSY